MNSSELTELRCWQVSITVWCFSSPLISHSPFHNVMAFTCSPSIDPMALLLQVPHSCSWVICFLFFSYPMFNFFFHSSLTFMEKSQNSHTVRKCNYPVHPVLSAINRSLYRSNNFLRLLPTSYLLTSLIVSWPLARRWRHLSVVINSWHLLCWAWWLAVVAVPGREDWEILEGGGHSEGTVKERAMGRLEKGSDAVSRQAVQKYVSHIEVSLKADLFTSINSWVGHKFFLGGNVQTQHVLFSRSLPLWSGLF